jgi:hypothetical protein
MDKKSAGNKRRRHARARPSNHELPIKHPNSPLVLTNDIQLLVRDIFWSLVILLGTLAACPAGVALVVRHDGHRVCSVDQA